jgi:hypothetical protein
VGKRRERSAHQRPRQTAMAKSTKRRSSTARFAKLMRTGHARARMREHCAHLKGHTVEDQVSKPDCVRDEKRPSVTQGRVNAQPNCLDGEEPAEPAAHGVLCRSNLARCCTVRNQPSLDPISVRIERSVQGGDRIRLLGVRTALS